jgi:hypothetical protein
MTEPPHRHHTLDYIEIPVVDVATPRSSTVQLSAGPSPTTDRTMPESRIPAEVPRSAGSPRRTRSVPGGLLVLLFSDDLDASVKAVVESGGSIVNGPYEFLAVAGLSSAIRAATSWCLGQHRRKPRLVHIPHRR